MTSTFRVQRVSQRQSYLQSRKTRLLASQAISVPSEARTTKFVAPSVPSRRSLPLPQPNFHRRLVPPLDLCSGVTVLTVFHRMKQLRRDLDCEDSTSSGKSNW